MCVKLVFVCVKVSVKVNDCESEYASEYASEKVSVWQYKNTPRLIAVSFCIPKFSTGMRVYVRSILHAL